MSDKMYCCIDLKSFYASVECVERGLNPMTTNLVVADPTRGNGSVCLAITPAMKKLGVKNRCRVFEIPKNIEYITAMPQMRKYMQVSADIYSVYLRYVSPEDIHVYSIDECFIRKQPLSLQLCLWMLCFMKQVFLHLQVLDLICFCVKLPLT